MAAGKMDPEVDVMNSISSINMIKIGTQIHSSWNNRVIQKLKAF
jgi:hypothetical protein